MTAPGDILATPQELLVAAVVVGVIVPTAWPPVLACPELKRLDFQGRAGRQAACGTKLYGEGPGKV